MLQFCLNKYSRHKNDTWIYKFCGLLPKKTTEQNKLMKLNEMIFKISDSQFVKCNVETCQIMYRIWQNKDTNEVLNFIFADYLSNWCLLDLFWIYKKKVIQRDEDYLHIMKLLEK